MKLEERLTNTFSQEGIISDEEREIVQFGLESIEGNLVGVVLTLVVGICFKHTKDALFLYLLLFPLRKSAGGFHAATKARCFLTSAAMLGISFTIFTVVDHTAIFYGICAGMLGCVVWILAPIDNPSKKLDEMECCVYRMRSRVILGVESVVLVLALCLGWEIITRSICMAFFIVSVSLLIGMVNDASA